MEKILEVFLAFGFSAHLQYGKNEVTEIQIYHSKDGCHELLLLS